MTSTGSEPRRWSLYEHPQLGWKVAERDPPDGHDRAELATLNGWPVVEVEEEGSGHDEQTEVYDSDLVDDMLIKERGRTVAAVVTALREGDRSRGLHGWPAAADFIENHPRFGSSVSGGE